jgi:uncharacterized protein YbaP (TraB family)
MTGPSPTALSRARPLMAYMIIHKERLQGYGYLGKQGIDRHFFDEAPASHKPVIGLETLEYQMNLVYWTFSGLPEDEQDKLLASALLRRELPPAGSTQCSKPGGPGTPQ